MHPTPERTLSSQTTSTVVSCQPYSVSSEKCRLPSIQGGTLISQSSVNQINQYKEPVGQQNSLNSLAGGIFNPSIGPGGGEIGTMTDGIGTMSISGGSHRPRTYGGLSGTDRQRIANDPTHPLHHNNVFEHLHNSSLSKEEKTDRLLTLLRKSQNKQRHWSTGLCDCSSGDKYHLVWQCLLGPIYQGCQAERMGEDFFTGCCMGSFFGLPLSCIPWLSSGPMISLRAKLRERHNILGAIFEDWLLYVCCMGSCANTQLYRELDSLGYPDSWLG